MPKVICLILALSCFALQAQDMEPPAEQSAALDDMAYPNGLSAAYGVSHEFSDALDYFLITYHRFWSPQSLGWENGSEALRLKMELSGGMRVSGQDGAVLSAVGMLQYYLDSMKNERFHPYVEAGIGAIYTDWRENNQAFRWNFNPQAGFGLAMDSDRGGPWFASIRWHHLSNASIDDDNHGVDTILFMLGKRF